MNIRKFVLGSILSVGLVAGGILIAQDKPVHNVNAAHHPHLAAAQHLVDQAYAKITEAQQANEFDMDGHAAHAKELLDQANKELKTSAEIAGKNHK
jgi:hypothetical protein